MSKKISVLNSPWGREYERPSDCARWIAQGHAVMLDASLQFTSKFIDSVTRECLESDPTGYDDGTPRRWLKRGSQRMPVLQLRPVFEVGTVKSVEHRPDNLRRRQSRRGIVRHIPFEIA